MSYTTFCQEGHARQVMLAWKCQKSKLVNKQYSEVDWNVFAAVNSISTLNFESLCCYHMVLAARTSWFGSSERYLKESGKKSGTVGPPEGEREVLFRALKVWCNVVRASRLFFNEAKRKRIEYLGKQFMIKHPLREPATSISVDLNFFFALFWNVNIRFEVGITFVDSSNRIGLRRQWRL